MGEKARYRSAVRSQRMLQEAYSCLLAERGPGEISVTDVVKRAGLNRSTFYAHYDNIDALAKELLGGILSKFNAVAADALEWGFIDDPEPVLAELAAYLESERAILRQLLRSHQADEFISWLRRELLDQTRESLRRAGKDESDVEYLVPTDYLSGALAAVYRSWIEGGYGDASVDDVTRLAAAYVRASAQAIVAGLPGGSVHAMPSAAHRRDGAPSARQTEEGLA